MKTQKHKSLLALSAIKDQSIAPKLTLTDSVIPDSSKVIKTNKSVITRENNSIMNINNDCIDFNNKELFEIYKRLSSKVAKQIKSNIKDVQSKSKMMHSLKRSFIIKPDDSSIDSVNKALMMEKDKLKRQTMEKDKLFSNYRRHLIKCKSNSRCINDYYSIESNLVDVYHDKLMVENEFNRVCKKNKELNEDTHSNSCHNQMPEVELNKKILNNIKLVIQKQNSNKKIINEDKSIGLLTGIGIGGINNIITNSSLENIASKSIDENSNILYSLNSNNNRMSIIKAQMRDKRKINIRKFMSAQRETKRNRIEFYKSRHDQEQKQEELAQDKDKDRNESLNDNSSQSKERDKYCPNQIRCNDILHNKYIQFKKEMKKEELRLFNNRIFSKDQIDSILKSKKHLKMNQIKQLIIKKKQPNDNSFIVKSLRKSSSTPTLPQINQQYNHHHYNLLIDKLTKAYDISVHPIQKFKLSDFIDFTGLVE